MKKVLLLFTAIFLIAGGYYLIPASQKGGGTELNEKISFEAKSDTQGSVTVTATPRYSAGREAALEFEIVMDTHSVELNDDLVKAAVMIADNGNEYRPSAWEGDMPGGHHRSGILKFQFVSSFPKSFELKIRGLGGIPERSLLWITSS